MTYSQELFDALGEAQGIGLLGDRPIAEVIAHAQHVVDALVPVRGHVVDLGSGGGVPGLVIADARPDLLLLLLDRREKRTDFLGRIVRRLGWQDRVGVLNADAAVAGRLPEYCGLFAAAVSRGFGPPTTTLRLSRPFVRPGGLIVLTDPPSDQADRWSVIPHDGLTRRSRPGAAAVVFQLD